MFMFMFYPQLIISIVIGVAIGVAAATLFFVLRSKRKGGGKLSKKQTIAQGIKANLADFNGMFEPMYSVSVGKNKNQKAVFAAWNDAVQASAEDNGYKALFNEQYGDYIAWGQKKKKFKEKKANKLFKKKAAKLVKTFFKGGILRGSDIYETGSETTAERYDFAGAGSVEADAVYEVLSPCWMCGDQIANKGVIR